MELSYAEQVELLTVEEMELPPAEQVELSPKLIKRRRGRLRKLTTAPPITVSWDKRVPNLATKEPKKVV
jgi:hypothetical protein